MRIGDNVDVYDNEKKVFANLKIEKVDDNRVHFFDKEFTCSILDDIRPVRKENEQTKFKTEYEIVLGTDKIEFEETIIELLNQGYMPLGGVSMIMLESGKLEFGQSMARTIEVSSQHLPEETK